MGEDENDHEVRDKAHRKRRQEGWPASVETGVPGTGPTPAEELPEGVEADIERAHREKDSGRDSDRNDNDKKKRDQT